MHVNHYIKFVPVSTSNKLDTVLHWPEEHIITIIIIYNVTYFAEYPGPEMPASDQPDCCPLSLHYHLPLFFSVIKYHAYTHS